MRVSKREQAVSPQLSGERLKPLFVGSLVERLFEHLDAKRKRRIFKKDTWTAIAKASGIPRDTLTNYVVRRNRPIPIKQLDKILWATETSVLDLLEPGEIFSYLKGLDYDSRQQLRINFNSLLDRLNKREHNHTSSADAQKSETASAKQDI